LIFGRGRKKRRERLRSLPLAAEWERHLAREVPLYRRLPIGDRPALHGLMQIFLDEKRFEGCGGLELTEPVKMVIAAQACVLLLHRETDVYPQLYSILVYPRAYMAPRVEQHDEWVVSEGEEELLGESWEEGSLVLSWEDIRHDAAHPQDGYNVVLHEFAHQLDDESGVSDGTPVLPTGAMYAEWAAVFGRDYEDLRRDLSRQRATLLDEYAAESPAEFFAVATEIFFMLPRDMAELQPELYDLLRRYYAQDPATWEAG
jgi:Mlc titration factor MtfA (ptsG expression regulator)